MSNLGGKVCLSWFSRILAKTGLYKDKRQKPKAKPRPANGSEELGSSVFKETVILYGWELNNHLKNLSVKIPKYISDIQGGGRSVGFCSLIYLFACFQVRCALMNAYFYSTRRTSKRNHKPLTFLECLTNNLMLEIPVLVSATYSK